jgi:hypothetical protein
MKTNRESEDTVEERQFARVPYLGRVQFVYGAGQKGSAHANDVGRGGLRVRMGRYLRPGTKLMVTIPMENSEEKSVELKSEVIWCRRERGHMDFGAGLRVYYDAPEALDAISEVMYYALLDQGGLKNKSIPRVAGRSMNFQGIEIASQPQTTACGLTC